ncbi:hypothetical protein NBH00_08710 [Paraconexibacter antarcticus]|uniref:Universal stress protein n=1 Tax=Paraconexibacter antarcticus TaxID=2949664 RepID=A0ABY5DMS0_9ACTN|nr:hypothetical protein [Paraconexibacter antarcticus]UTI63308.1 hypothetical protein NBH00_18355 [Paraconexibacter antarcticus]UTI66272.1 hypothetical protein NBH00_08710 [Paraconexibacter antarcticus]
MSTTEKPARILVLADRTATDPALLEAMRERAARGPAQFRFVVPNPAPAEWHPMHPERRDKAAEAERALTEALPAIEEAAGGPVIASVSIRHDPMDVVDGVMFHEPIDEIILSQASHPIERWFHVDLPHRLAHLKVPLTVVDSAG